MFTLDKEDISQASWSRAARGYELKILTKKAKVNQFDGFQQEVSQYHSLPTIFVHGLIPQQDLDRVSKAFKIWFNVVVDHKEHALRGWNWGKTEFGRAELSFNVQNRPAFEFPYDEITNTNLAGKAEVAVDFSAASGAPTNGQVNGDSQKTHKMSAARDQLVEARFYIPGTTLTNEANEDGEGSGDEGPEESSAASVWYDTLVDKAQIGDVAGDSFASFMDVLHLTPRGRFDIDLYESSFRLRGKTYDYKIQYDNIKKFFLLPKPDDVHTLITIGLDPPLRQGQTRYPFVVMQFKREEDVELDVNVSEEDLEGKYKDRLQTKYSGPSFIVLTHLFRGLASKKVISPSKEFSSRHNQSAVKCSIKANEGQLYCMDKSFMFVPKPATYIAMDHISAITMSRVGGAVSASRTFDITMILKGGHGEHQFSNINRYVEQFINVLTK